MLVIATVGALVGACTTSHAAHDAGVARPAASAQTGPTTTASTTPTALASPSDLPSVATRSVGPASVAPTPVATGPLPAMPPVDDPSNIYSHDAPGMLSPVVNGFRSLVYVPNSVSNTVDEIDPATHQIVAHFAVPAQPQHVVPSYDLRTLWVNSDVGNALVPIDPRTGTPGKPVPVADPYNLYFTPDGKFAVVMAERMHRIDWRDPHTMALEASTKTGCVGVNHADFSADGRYFIASCEFDGQLLKVDTTTKHVVARLSLKRGAAPQDVKLSPDGKVFYVADMAANGVWEVDGEHFKVIGFIATGRGAHGLYVSRDAKYLYVTNRGEGSISLVDLSTRQVAQKWRIPGGGTPDMGGVSADGTQLWVSGRYSGVVYDISTTDGHLIAKIPVGSGPHGVCVYPQPGRYSLGHTGVFR